jgi:hypothetical protein
MIIDIDNTKYGLGTVRQIKTKTNLDVGEYFLAQMNFELTSVLHNLNVIAKKVDLKVVCGGKIILDGKDCLFFDIDRMNGTAKLVVTFVNEDHL